MIGIQQRATTIDKRRSTFDPPETDRETQRERDRANEVAWRQLQIICRSINVRFIALLVGPKQRPEELHEGGPEAAHFNYDRRVGRQQARRRQRRRWRSDRGQRQAKFLLG